MDHVRDITLHKPRPEILDKRDSQRDAERHERAVYAEVDARDLKRCRICMRRGNPYAVDALGRIHRCHIKDASRGGEFAARNIFSGCWICHSLIHAKQVFVLGTNANARLEFEIEEAAVIDVFGTRPVPSHVHIIAGSVRR